MGGADASAASHEADCGDGGQAMDAKLHRRRMGEVAAVGEAAKAGDEDHEWLVEKTGIRSIEDVGRCGRGA